MTHEEGKRVLQALNDITIEVRRQIDEVRELNNLMTEVTRRADEVIQIADNFVTKMTAVESKITGMTQSLTKRIEEVEIQQRTTSRIAAFDRALGPYQVFPGRIPSPVAQ